MKRKKILFILLGMIGISFIGKKIINYKKDKSISSIQSWLLHQSFLFFTWPFKVIESDFLYDKFIKILHRRQEDYIEFPKLKSLKVAEYFIDDMQVILFNEQKDPKQKVVFYLHGGGYLSPPTPLHFKLVTEIAQETNAKIIMPNYPKAPKYTFKEAYPKVLKAYQHMFKQHASMSNLTILGDSSGGGLAVGLSSLLIKEDIPQPDKLVLISPWLDASSENPDIGNRAESDALLPAQKYLKRTGRLWAGGKEGVYHPLVSPIYADNLGQLPPIYIIMGEDEMLYPDLMRFKEKMASAGQEIDLFIKEDMVHDFAIFNTPEGKEARKLISELIIES